jgi:hypothetical protein
MCPIELHTLAARAVTAYAEAMGTNIAHSAVVGLSLQMLGGMTDHSPCEDCPGKPGCKLEACTEAPASRTVAWHCIAIGLWH